MNLIYLNYFLNKPFNSYFLCQFFLVLNILEILKDVLNPLHPKQHKIAIFDDDETFVWFVSELGFLTMQIMQAGHLYMKHVTTAALRAWRLYYVTTLHLCLITRWMESLCCMMPC